MQDRLLPARFAFVRLFVSCFAAFALLTTSLMLCGQGIPKFDLSPGPLELAGQANHWRFVNAVGEKAGPRWSSQKRPYVVTSKPAIGIGLRRDCFTLPQCGFARRDLSRYRYGRFPGLLDAW